MLQVLADEQPCVESGDHGCACQHRICLAEVALDLIESGFIAGHLDDLGLQRLQANRAGRAEVGQER